jgi:hypothetical protein
MATAYTTGILFVMRTRSIASFSYGSADSDYKTREAALEAAQDFVANHRRSAKCSIVEIDGELVQAAAEAAAVKPPVTDKRDKRRKLDLIQLREDLKTKSIRELADEMLGAEDGRVLDAAAKEAAAKVCVKRLTRELRFLHKNEVIVIVPQIAKFRRV